ncbi:hypothetical protein K2173_015142 [Erythroxylum novogranatense]|uniref:S-adenosylmethionine-dependent methyltransferase At5g38100 n=1 Tax=Erythroxylum novogranatense TaxID=1862640 RepID=A0AAV8T2I8_9ROSI|nr:hypothetical protein K2173_015142 [Erythroxylum novogranatense]
MSYLVELRRQEKFPLTSSHCHSSGKFLRAIIEATIASRLDLSSVSSTFCLADLGNSSGPRTFNYVQNILEAFENKLRIRGLHQDPDQMPDLQVFFTYLPADDFNVQYLSLPPQRQYFSAVVPGSLHTRLFPKSSLHFIHSSYALQWLSQAPQAVVDQDSPAWNKGRVHYTNAPQEVCKAFATQFAKDMGAFLDARAKELTDGGLMLLLLPSIPDETYRSREPMGLMFDHLGSCLMDMAREGLVREYEVDTFNIPIYAATPKEMTEIIERNRYFSIERMDSTITTSPSYDRSSGHIFMTCLRAGMEDFISKHFGVTIIDELFDRFWEKIDNMIHTMQSKNCQGSQLAVFLKRN